MMKLYSIYDKVAKRYNAPFMCENEEVAKRSFNASVKGLEWAFDFELYQLGDIDLETGKITPNLVFITGFIGGETNG